MRFDGFGGKDQPSNPPKTIKCHQKLFDEIWWDLTALMEKINHQKHQKPSKAIKKIFDEIWRLWRKNLCHLNHQKTAREVIFTWKQNISHFFYKIVGQLRKKQYLCSAIVWHMPQIDEGLSYSVMVTQRFLVPHFLVRVRVGQPTNFPTAWHSAVGIFVCMKNVCKTSAK